MKTIAKGVVAVLAQECERRGFDLYAALRARAVTPEAIDDIEGRVPLAALDAALEPVAAPDPTGFALSALEHGAFSGRAYFQFLSANAADVRDYLELTLRFGRLLSDGAMLRARHEADAVSVEHVLIDPKGRTEAALYVARVAWLGGFVLRARVFSNLAFVPLQMCIAAPPPRHARPLHPLFGIEPEFEAASTSVRFERSLLELPFASANPTLRGVLAQRAEAALEALPQSDDVYGSVKSALLARLRARDVSLDAVAAVLGKAPSTLQDELRAAGVSFPEIVEESRTELALAYLAREEQDVEDIARSLGFDSPSAFARWYRRAIGRATLH